MAIRNAFKVLRGRDDWDLKGTGDPSELELRVGGQYYMVDDELWNDIRNDDFFDQYLEDVETKFSSRRSARRSRQEPETAYFDTGIDTIVETIRGHFDMGKIVDQLKSHYNMEKITETLKHFIRDELERAANGVSRRETRTQGVQTWITSFDQELTSPAQRPDPKPLRVFDAVVTVPLSATSSLAEELADYEYDDPEPAYKLNRIPEAADLEEEQPVVPAPEAFLGKDGELHTDSPTLNTNAIADLVQSLEERVMHGQQQMHEQWTSHLGSTFSTMADQMRVSLYQLERNSTEQLLNHIAPLTSQLDDLRCQMNQLSTSVSTCVSELSTLKAQQDSASSRHFQQSGTRSDMMESAFQKYKQWRTLNPPSDPNFLQLREQFLRTLGLSTSETAALIRWYTNWWNRTGRRQHMEKLSEPPLRTQQTTSSYS